MDDSQAVLTWDRGVLEAECDRSAPVREGVEAYLGRKVFGATGDVVIRVSLERVQERGQRRVEAKVTQEDSQGRTWGERRVSGDASCDSLDPQLTLVIALMVDSPDPTVSGEPEPTPIPSQPPPTSVADDEPAKSSPIVTVPSLERPPPSPPHAVLLGFGAAALGATPELGLGAGLAATFKPRGFWGLGVDATLLAPQRQALDSGSLKVSLLMAGASLCPFQAVEGAAWWSICGSFHVARLGASSRGLLESRRAAQFLALPGVNARAGRVLAGRWLVGAGVQLSFPVSPDRYVYRDSEGERHVAFEVSSFVLVASAGFGVIFQ
jgi:hypothetical protein